MSSALAQACAVALGGAVGALLRHGINMLLPRSTQHAFSISTLSVNVVGCFLAGLLLVWVMQRAEIDFWRALLLTGLLGGLTTFSAFGLDLLHLVRIERWSWLALTILLHVAFGLVAVVAGWKIGQVAWPTP